MSHAACSRQVDANDAELEQIKNLGVVTDELTNAALGESVVANSLRAHTVAMHIKANNHAYAALERVKPLLDAYEDDGEINPFEFRRHETAEETEKRVAEYLAQREAKKRAFALSPAMQELYKALTSIGIGANLNYPPNTAPVPLLPTTAPRWTAASDLD